MYADNKTLTLTSSAEDLYVLWHKMNYDKINPVMADNKQINSECQEN